MNALDTQYKAGYEAGRRDVFNEMRQLRTKLVGEVNKHRASLEAAIVKHDALATALDMFTDTKAT